MISAGRNTSWSTPITSRANARVKALRASFRCDASEPGDVLGIEGEQMISEAVRSGMKLQTLFIREGSVGVVERMCGVAGTEVVVLSGEVFSSAVGTASPKGIAAMVAVRWPEPCAFSNGAVLILENLQDPGNLGTLIRSAEAFGARRVFLTKRTVNQWNAKVVRASAGSVFRVPVTRASLEEIAAEVKSLGVVVYAAVAQEAGAASVMETAFGKKCGLMIGNEGAGLSADAIGMAQHRVWIPCAVESLNAAVAGSTLLYEAMRQRGSLGHAGSRR